MIRVDPRKDQLQLFIASPDHRPFNGFRGLEDWLAGQGGRLEFAMNAGMFEADYSPVGLFIAEGQSLKRLNLSTGRGNFYLKPNGVFLLSSSGAMVLVSFEFEGLHRNVVLASQSGPLLVHRGELHPAFGPDSDSKKIRSAVGVATTREVLFVISKEPVNFFELATFFRDIFHSPDALLLDRTVSGVYAPGLGRDDERGPLGPIIGIALP